METNIWKCLASGWECSHLDRKYGLFLTVYVDDTKVACKQENLSNMCARLRKEVDLEASAPFLTQVYLGRTRREAQVKNGIVVEKTKVVNKAYHRQDGCPN